MTNDFDLGLYDHRRKAGQTPDVEEEQSLTERYIARCQQDWEFFAAKEQKIQNKDGQIVPFLWNHPQRNLADTIVRVWRSGEPVRIIVLKARQWGCTTLVASFIDWQTTMFGYRKAQIISQDEDSTNTIFEMYEFYRDNHSDLVKRYVEKGNRKHGYTLDNGSMVRVRTAGTKQVAAKVGRSKTNQLAHHSEVAFWDSPRQTHTASGRTIKRGPFTFIIDESTPNGAGGLFFERYRLAKRSQQKRKALGKPEGGLMNWFVAWFDIPEYSKKTTREHERLWETYQKTKRESDRETLGLHRSALERKEEFPNLTLGQLQWWNEYLVEEMNSDEEMMNQEYPWDDISCFLASGRPAYNPHDISRMRKHVYAPQRMDLKRDKNGWKKIYSPTGLYQLWEEPTQDSQYLITADICSGYQPGHAKMLDRSRIHVYERMHGGGLHHVLSYGGRCEPDEVGEMMCLLGAWYNWAWLAPEVNSYGVAALATIRKKLYPYVYRRLEVNTATGNWHRNQLGWYTSDNTKRLAVGTTKKKLRKGLLITHDEDVVDEMSSLIVNHTSGKVEAPDGDRDDCADATMIACEVSDELYDIEADNPRKAPEKSEVKKDIERWDALVRSERSSNVYNTLQKDGFYDYE